MPDLTRGRMKLAERMGNPGGKPHDTPPVSPRTPVYVPRVPTHVRAWRYGAYTAAVALLLIAAWRVVPWQRMTQTDINTAHYITPRAQIQRIDLADGSQVVLGPQSELRVATTAEGSRIAELTGHALFTIVHRDASPFIVQVGGVRTRVLGTVFDVQHYAEDAAVRVQVVEGRVASHGVRMPERAAAILAAGMAGVLTDSSAELSTLADPAVVTRWTAGTLVFSKAPVSVMLATLERWSSYEFQLTDSTLRRRHVTTSISVQDPSEMLSLLQDLLDVAITVHGRVVVLTPRSTASPAPLRRPAPSSPPHTRRGDVFTPSRDVGK